MIDELLPYYNRELTFIRQMAAEFAEKYPKIAGRLALEPDRCDDPHVERLIEAFALLSGRVQHKIDDEFPEITEALLDVLYPHYLRPVPSFAIVQFQPDPSQSAAAEAIQVPAGTTVRTKPVEGDVCSFRTCYPVSLWPLRVTDASVASPGRFAGAGFSQDTASVLRIEVECLGGIPFSKLRVDSLRFYLRGESALVHLLYEVLFLNTLRISLRALPVNENSPRIILPSSSFRQVGFNTNEGLLPYSDRSFLGYRLLQEYFAFPEKFLFFDIAGLDRIPKADFGPKFEILISLRQTDASRPIAALEQGVNAGTFQLGCAPVVNLFERIAEPVRITHTKTEYRVIPDQHRQLSTEVYSVDKVTSVASYGQEPEVYEPFYAVRHGSSDARRPLWYTHRRSSFRKDGDKGTEVYISLVDADFNPASPPVEMLSLRVTCTNRDAAARLQLSDDFGEVQTEGIPLVRTRVIRKPTAAMRPPLRRRLQWRLISHLALNHLSIVEKGRDALREILSLYNFSEDPAVRKQIDGIRNVSSRSSISRVRSSVGVAFCRGTDVTIEFDEDEYAGASVFLLASVLERFLGLYSALNSYSRLTAVTKRGVLKQWPPLAGEQILL